MNSRCMEAAWRRVTWCLVALPSYAPVALWLSELWRACAESWGRCSAWSSQESDRHRASVNVREGKTVHVPLHLYSLHTEHCWMAVSVKRGVKPEVFALLALSRFALPLLCTRQTDQVDPSDFALRAKHWEHLTHLYSVTVGIDYWAELNANEM